MDNKDLPAYPLFATNGGVIESGLTKLEIVSAMCLQGLLASGHYTEQPIPNVVETASIYANALLTHLSNTEK